MMEISLSKISRNFGFKRILDEFNLDIKTGEKIALIGPNGCGKSTILKIIVGEESKDSGNISIRKNVTIGMLSQIPPKAPDDYYVLDILDHAFDNLRDIEKRLKSLEDALQNETNANKIEKLYNEYYNLQQKYQELGGYEQRTLLSKVTAAFKIDDKIDRKFNDLSGGEKTIVYLASLILSNPDILLLDEPTNHLDIDTLEWLENYLKNYRGTILLVSHDRFFLDKVATKTVLIERGKSEIFFGNYSYYLKENEKRIMLEFESYKDQQKMIEAMKNKIKRLQEYGKLAFPNGEMFFKRAASIQKRLDKIEILDKPESKKELPLDFKVSNRSGGDVLFIKKLNLSVGDKELLKNASMELTYGEKICLMGKNGSGKSTLIKKIISLYENKETMSCIKIGSNVKIGYIPQEIRFDDPKMTVFDVARLSFVGSESNLRAALFKFLFYDDNIYKRVDSLSGGEKVRLKLFELIQKKANFLILDEPTNHIDINTKDMLEEALLEYNGSLLFISHDRYFINKLAQKIILIDDYKLNSFIGNYEYFKEKNTKDCK